jgi:hypothetical protein
MMDTSLQVNDGRVRSIPMSRLEKTRPVGSVNGVASAWSMTALAPNATGQSTKVSSMKTEGHRTRQAAEEARVHFVERTKKPRKPYTRKFPEPRPHHPGYYAGGTRESETAKNEEHLRRMEEWEARKLAWERERESKRK